MWPNTKLKNAQKCTKQVLVSAYIVQSLPEELMRNIFSSFFISSSGSLEYTVDCCLLASASPTLLSISQPTLQSKQFALAVLLLLPPPPPSSLCFLHLLTHFTKTLQRRRCTSLLQRKRYKSVRVKQQLLALKFEEHLCFNCHLWRLIQPKYSNAEELLKPKSRSFFKTCFYPSQQSCLSFNCSPKNKLFYNF